ncbi:hypothetical protein [Thaumasiovibrio subtropicus]|uniref:hypothetical protein n=1 Tax=Thaumasiovibrio subtropicus TaxID=1891207 RepID=UPI000B35791C|nr:hypothetical protein [Thaumasiovibrio subtropicus]
MTKVLDEITINDLPGRVRISLPHAPDSSSSSPLLWIGFILLFVGAVFIIFGPNQIRVSPSGMTFLQFLQIYPGPIASVGGFCIWGANRMHNSELEHYVKAVNEVTDRVIKISDEEVPEGYELSIERVEGEEEIFDVSLVEKSEEPDENPEATAL